MTIFQTWSDKTSWRWPIWVGLVSRITSCILTSDVTRG